jgi:hypothetical protein
MTHLLTGLLFFVCGCGVQDAYEHQCRRALWLWSIAATVLGAGLTIWEVFA